MSENNLTVGTKEYIDTEIAKIKELMALHATFHENEHKFTKEALDKAADALASRLAGVNEFRQTLVDQAQTFARQDTIDARFHALEEKTETRATANTDRIDTANKSLSDRVYALEKAGIQLQGGHSGSVDTFRYIVMGVAFLATLLGIFGIVLSLLNK